MTDPSDLVQLAEIAKRAGVGRTTVNRWSANEGFPTPVAEFGGRIWSWPEVELWIRRYLATKPKPVPPRNLKFSPEQREEIREAARTTYNVSALARQFQTSRETIYKIAGDVISGDAN